MAKCIYVCSRKELPEHCHSDLSKICTGIAPDNIHNKAPKIHIGKKVAYGVVNPVDSIAYQGDCLMLGALYGDGEDWQVPGTSFPDGSFSIYRSDEHQCEFVSDVAGSRTIWYYYDDELFIGSNSQRAIVMYLGTFVFNAEVIPWVLSTGTLGPESGWDTRIHRVPADGSVLLDRNDWTLRTHVNPAVFKANRLSEGENKTRLFESLDQTFGNLHLNFKKWRLPLSGGYDSRGILQFLLRNVDESNHLTAITWGLESSLEEEGNDAFIAKQLAAHYGIAHTYFHTDLSNEPLEVIFGRFFHLGEGRTDHISGYMDGFRIWKTLFENGIEGIIRGDEGFGWLPTPSELYVRHTTGISLCSDFANLKDYRKFGLRKQQVPAGLKRRRGESLASWRDRLYHEFRLPVLIAGLTDLKVAYVEQICPLLSKRTLSVIREVPDQLRTNKSLFKDVLADLNVNIPYATSDAIADPGNILKSENAVRLLREYLGGEHLRELFDPSFLERIRSNLTVAKPKVPGTENRKRNKRRLPVPGFVKSFIRRFYLPQASSNVLAFRIYLIGNMSQMLNKDTTLL